MVDFIKKWSERSGLPLGLFLKALSISRETYSNWRKRYGQLNEHNGSISRDHQLLEEERDKIINYNKNYSMEGYRRLTYLMIDEDVVYVSPSTTYRVLVAAGLIRTKKTKPSKKGKGFNQPGSVHRHWHIDITHIKIKGIFYYLMLVLDGYSRYIVGWDLRHQMTEQDVEIALQKAHEHFPGVTPRVISDNGSQFISKEFKHFIGQVGMTHTLISPYYPQSNGEAPFGYWLCDSCG